MLKTEMGMQVSNPALVINLMENKMNYKKQTLITQGIGALMCFGVFSMVFFTPDPAGIIEKMAVPLGLMVALGMLMSVGFFIDLVDYLKGTK